MIISVFFTRFAPPLSIIVRGSTMRNLLYSPLLRLLVNQAGIVIAAFRRLQHFYEVVIIIEVI